MDKAVSSIRLEHWKELILEAGASGMTRKDWCREHGIPLRQYYYWQKKVRDDALEELKTVRSDSCMAALPVPQPSGSFVELHVPAAGAAEIPSEKEEPSRQMEGFRAELVLETDRCRLLIGDKVCEKALQTVVRAMLYA